MAMANPNKNKIFLQAVLGVSFVCVSLSKGCSRPKAEQQPNEKTIGVG